MTEAQFFHSLWWAMMGLSVVTCVSLFVITAPYGRHNRAGWGPSVPSTVGWIIMEAPASLCFLAFYFVGEHRADQQMRPRRRPERQQKIGVAAPILAMPVGAADQESGFALASVAPFFEHSGQLD